MGIPRTTPPATSFNRLVLPRLGHLGLDRREFCGRLSILGMRANPPFSIDEAFLWRIIHRGHPVPAAWVPAIARVLDWPKDSTEYRALVTAVEEISAKRKQHGGGVKYVKLLEMKVIALEGELAEARKVIEESKRIIERQERTNERQGRMLDVLTQRAPSPPASQIQP
jgi:hypothetical protein